MEFIPHGLPFFCRDTCSIQQVNYVSSYSLSLKGEELMNSVKGIRYLSTTGGQWIT